MSEPARLARLLDVLPLPVAIFDAEHRLVRCNPSFAEVTGLGGRPAVGLQAIDAFPSALAEIAPILEVAKASPHKARIAFMHSGRPRLMEATFIPLAGDDAGGGMLFFATDVTEHERAVAHEARSRERRLAAVGQLAAGVMHDVNNALNPIVAAAYLLEVHADDPAAVRDYARRIAMAAETGAATAARVGRFIRQEPMAGGSEETVDLDVVADEVLAMTRPVWTQRVERGSIELVRQSHGAAHARGIAGEVREALLNLVQNAIDAMSLGGTLTVTTGAEEESAWVEVRDSGPGMSDEVRERAFEPFFSTKGRKGTGLGLAEVYGIMKRHRGQVELKSEPGEGATVRLTFPRATCPAGITPAGSRAIRSRRILIVEDHEDGREFMRALLQSDGHAVVGACGVRDAMEKLAGDGGFDLLIADIGLPDGTGWDLVRSVRDRFPHMHVGVVTGWEPRSEPQVPVSFSLRKPVRAQALLDVVAQVTASDTAEKR
jgi:signal transduction histidine kinase/CheY-like chemotaxis protein